VFANKGLHLLRAQIQQACKHKCSIHLYGVDKLPNFKGVYVARLQLLQGHLGLTEQKPYKTPPVITSRKLLTSEIPSLSAQDEPMSALDLMDQFRISHLPVVENGKFLGIIGEDALMDLESLQGDSSGLPLIRSHALPDMHIFDVLKMASEHRLSIIPVVDAENNYLGAIRMEDLIEQISEMQGATQRGGILVLEMWEKDYSMQQISRIIEENNAKILSTTLSPGEGGKIEVNIKLNQPDLNAIISSFERFGYNVKANYQESAYTEDLRKRYDELMRILNI
jgi:predicted transcriptional regulator